MVKIGRNDLCPCGSGEKYKKCCGKNNVLSMELLIEKELHEIQLDILHYAMENYQEEMEDYLEECYEEFDIPDEAMEMFNFFGTTWFITSVEVDEETILEEYIDRNIEKFSRQRIKDILRTWKKAKPSVSIIQHQEGNQHITVQDIFSQEVQKVKVLEEEHKVETGGLVLGTILPAGPTSVFFTTFLDMPADESEELKDAVLSLYDESGEESPVDFMAASFLEVLDLFIFGKADVSIDDLEWKSAKHKEVAVNYQEYMKNYGHEETVIHLGVYLWNTYCMRRNPTIKKSNVYEAALVYLVDKLLPFGGMITQKELAEEFDISSNSISTKFKELENVLSEEIEDLHDKLETIDDEDAFFDGEHIFGEEKVGNAFTNSRITMERELLNMEREIGDRDFESIDELNDFMNKRINNQKPSPAKLSDKEKAQELLFDAYEASGSKRLQLAKKALKLYPNSPDAYNILAEYEMNPKERQNLYLKGMEAGEKELGQSFFSENKGHFWGIVSTRAYMRAKFSYGLLLHEKGKREEAIAQYEELLELNPMDNQGVRYELFIAHVEKGLFQKAESLLKQFNEEITANGAFNKLLIEYLQNGTSQKAKKLLKKAKGENPYVLDYLTGKKKLPGNTPATYGLGDESEAIIYADQHLHLWREHVELIEWLMKA
ncbi:hypothetical protein ELQ35_20670 [Peribacillus cavernae]|uniref:Uncharacterized protein n=1 Tax=Peribacillus cavernae TaxID=1674310 RepID=A0A433HAG0_9BACI|nr:SEC-C metal-binding domain-containing protein [Peribacillus cavernae]MDQ0219777.1 tetratricopeptide (TPR) repeat protein [Peribacillus cavernae]RUQ25192.1 hypothetical protein ELQ35_20670 [Peribacillus cavernae]